MSMLMMVKAFKIQCGSPIKKLILLKLADNANDQGLCWPSHQHIADQCECSRRAVINNLASLEKMGLLKSENRVKDGIKQSNKYILTLDNPDVNHMHIDVNVVHGGSEPDAQGGSERGAHRISNSFEPVNEPVKNIVADQPDQVLENKKIKFNPKKALQELGIADDLIDDWLAIRKTKKMPLTQRALNLTIAEAEKAGLTLTEAIDCCAARIWGGFMAEYLENKKVPSAKQAIQTEKERRIADYYKSIGQPNPSDFIDAEFSQVGT